MSLAKVIQSMKSSPGSPDVFSGGTAAARIPPSGSPSSPGSPEKNKGESEKAAVCAVRPPPRQSPGLLATIKRMAMFCGYTDENLAYALSDARANPDTWRELIRNDRNAALFIQEIPPHQIEVVNMLRADSSLRYAFTTRIEGEDVIVSLAVRDVAVCDLTMPANSYDPLTFWKTINEVTQ